MRANWKLFRNKWIPAIWSLLRKRRSLKRKVKLTPSNILGPTELVSVSFSRNVLTLPLSCPVSAVDCA